MRNFRFYLRSLFFGIIIVLVANTSIASAVDEGFYSSNDILYYDPNAQACTTGETTSTLTIEQKIGQILYVGFPNLDTAGIKTVAQKYQLGGIYVWSGMTDTIAKDINSSMKSGLLISSDDEGGQVKRMISGEPSAKKLGTMSDAQVLAAGKDTGTKLKKLGLTGVLGPVLDIDTGLKNAISPFDRSFSSDPTTIAKKATAWADGVTSSGVGVTFKHFPGIGSNTGNTDQQYVEITSKKTIDDFKEDLVPYNTPSIRDHKGASVMLANFVLPGWGSDPVSVNPKAVTYLRNTIGFKGMVTTDDLFVMSKYTSHTLSLEQSVTKALNAGVDMPLFSYPGDAELDSIINAVKSSVSVDKINLAYAHAMQYKTDLGISTNAANSTATTGGSSIVVAGGDNEQKIFQFLISTSFKGLGDKPMNAVQAAGAIGNFFQESGWRFNAIQNGHSEVSASDTSSGVGYGIAQWDSDRRVTLIALANKMGKKWSDPEVQFAMLKEELDGGEGTRLAGFNGGKFMTTTDPAEASYLFMASYERAGTPAQANRDNAAKAAYDKYKGLAPGDAFSSTCLSGDSTSGTTTGKSDGSKATFVTSDGYAVYIQTDPRWSSDPYSSTTIGRSACGPSSMTMIITALTGKAMDIHEVVKVAADGGMYVPGQGSSWDVGPYLAKKFGLKATKIPKSVSAVNAAVKSGGYVIMSGQGSVPFTSGGHYIHVRGITSDGKWRIGDSAHKAANETPYDPNYILSMANDNLYSITK